MKLYIVILAIIWSFALWANPSDITLKVTEIPAEQASATSPTLPPYLKDLAEGRSPSKQPTDRPPSSDKNSSGKPWLDRPPRAHRPSTKIERFIIIGQKIWEIVKEGRPTVNVADINAVDILPGIEGKDLTAFDLSSWSLPKVKYYQVEMKNGLGQKVIDMQYRIFFSYGGTYDGSGSYLAGITVEPTHVKAHWGFNLDMSVEVTSVVNMGTIENPLPALSLQIRYHVSSVVSDSKNRDTYTIVGDGRLIEYD